MNGRVIHTPTRRRHRCAPGWTSQPFPAGHEMAGRSYGVPPRPDLFPRGTLWECVCGKVWKSSGPIAPNAPGICGWRPESKLARALRRRRERACA